MVNDKSKPISEGGKYAIFQKQGTYQCQVREFGSVQRTTSNSIILTYRRILNGIVSLWPTDANTFTSNREIMEQVTNFVHQVYKKPKLIFILFLFNLFFRCFYLLKESSKRTFQVYQHRNIVGSTLFTFRSRRNRIPKFILH